MYKRLVQAVRQTPDDFLRRNQSFKDGVRNGPRVYRIRILAGSVVADPLLPLLVPTVRTGSANSKNSCIHQRIHNSLMTAKSTCREVDKHKSISQGSQISCCNPAKLSCRAASVGVETSPKRPCFSHSVYRPVRLVISVCYCHSETLKPSTLMGVLRYNLV